MNYSSDNAAPSRSLPPAVWWVTTVAWAVTIFYMSTGTFGGQFTQWLLHQILDVLKIGVSANTFLILHAVFRKLAHLTEYTVFGMLLYGSFGGGQRFEWRARPALASVVIAAVYSLTDEFHQSFVPGRGPSLIDCGIDASGATLGMLVLYARDRWLRVKASRVAARNASPADR